MTIYYKVLGTDRKPCHGGAGQWPEPGMWLEVAGKLAPCENAIHACRREDLIHWLGPTIWTLEFEGEPAIDDNKVYGRKARLLSQLTTWNERTARLFAADCAEHVLHLFEQRYPNDPRPRVAIEMARAFADGRVSLSDMKAAEAAAQNATQAASASAAWIAAWAATEVAVTQAVLAATRAAERAATSASMGVAEWAAAEATERDWQTERLFDYLEGRLR